MNAGFKLVGEDAGFKADCMVMHDVDMIAVDETLSYECSSSGALFLAAKRWKTGQVGEKLLGQSFGAVSSISMDLFRKVNGYSNLYWGWGGEDDDLLKRIKGN